MNKLLKLALPALAAIALTVSPVFAGELSVTNNDDYIFVREDGKRILTMFTCGETWFAKDKINLLSDPDEKAVVKTVKKGTELLKVGRSAEWSMVNVDDVNYFVDNSDLVEEKPAEATKTEGMEYLGTWTLTAYCNGACCCGQWAGGGTASGTVPTAGRTIATNELPFGTEVYIEGLGNYIVEDRGWSPYYPWADIYFDSHSEALSFGMRYADVYVAR